MLWSNWNSQALLVGIHAGLVHLEQPWQLLIKLNTPIIRPSSPIPRNLAKTNKNECPQKSFLIKARNHPNVHQQMNGPTICGMKYYSVKKKKRNLKMSEYKIHFFGKRSQMQKTIHYLTPFIWNFGKSWGGVRELSAGGHNRSLWRWWKPSTSCLGW